jgi:hypothetical protein
VAALDDLTFKELLNGAIPDGFTYPVFLDVREGGTAPVWDQGDMRLQLVDHDWTSGTSSALSFAVTQEYEVKIQIEVQDNWWGTGGPFSAGAEGSAYMSDFSSQITNVRDTWGRWLNSIDVVLFNGNWISIDVDSEVDGIHHSRFGLNDAVVEGEVINEDVRITLLEVKAAPVEEEATGMRQLYENTRLGRGTTPFSRFELYGETTFDRKNKNRRAGDLWLDDDDAPELVWWNNLSGGVLLEVKQGWYVTLEIMNEDSGYFSPLKAALSLDPRLGSDNNFEGADSEFTITLYGGGYLYADVDDEFGAGGALGGPFAISTGTNGSAYALQAVPNDEFNISLVDYGEGEDPHNGGTDPQCQDGYEWDEATQQCVPIGGGGGGGGGGDDPFDIFDNQDAPFDEEDGVVDRLLKTFTFGVNSTFRAFEAVVEGAMLALPAIIIIVAAVVAANLVVGATKTGTEKAKQLIAKAGSMRQNMSIDIEGME